VKTAVNKFSKKALVVPDHNEDTIRKAA
jgi:hypothetical protein